MNNILKFPKTYEYIDNIPTPVPKTAEDYLRLCKKLLTEEDYVEVCMAILDPEEYDATEVEIKRIVDSYYAFVEKTN